ncbi:MAG: hypothetical protein WC806_00705 [Candidatus Gracilibacteria bacterium]|jgi:hypothetical protein
MIHKFYQLGVQMSLFKEKLSLNFSQNSPESSDANKFKLREPFDKNAVAKDSLPSINLELSLNNQKQNVLDEAALQREQLKSTTEFRSNLKKALEAQKAKHAEGSYWTIAAGHDYTIADDYAKELKEIYKDSAKMKSLQYVDPTMDTGMEKETKDYPDQPRYKKGKGWGYVPGEDPLELRINVERGGGDTRLIPEYIWAKYKEENGIPGIGIRFTADKDDPMKEEYMFIPIVDKAEYLKAKGEIAPMTAQENPADAIPPELKNQLDQRRAKLLVDLKDKKLVLPIAGVMDKRAFELAQITADKNFNKSADKSVNRIMLQSVLEIDPNQWSINDNQSLNKMFLEWQAMDIPVSEPFYQHMFFVLSDRNGKKPKDENQQKWFANPLNNIAKIREVDPEYAIALAQFVFVKASMIENQQNERNIVKRQANEGMWDSALDTAKTSMQKNWNSFSKAIREKDYVTAGAYAVGAYAMYRLIKGFLPASESGANKYLWGGAALGFGYVFMKNTGIDLGKKLGISREDDEVAGLSLEALTNNDLPETKGYNPSILLKVADVEVSQLHNLFLNSQYSEQSTESPGSPPIIPPTEFPDIFPGLTPYGARSKEYKETGDQLYKTVLLLKANYNKYISNHTDLSFEEAMQDPVYGNMRIKDFASLVKLYAPRTEKPGILGMRAKETATADLKAAFGTMPFNIDAPIDDKKYPGRYKGSVMGYPVKIAYEGESKSYRIYLANEYDSDEAPGSDFISIPAEQSDFQTGLADKLKTKIDGRMQILFNLVDLQGQTPPVYDSAYGWYVNSGVSSPNFGISQRNKIIQLNPSSDGKGLKIQPYGSSYIETIDETMPGQRQIISSTVKEKMLYGAILEKMTLQKNFKLFQYLSAGKMLDIDSINEPAATFTLKINSVSQAINVQYKNGTFSFVTPGQEKALINDPAFADSLVSSIQNNEDYGFNKNTKALIDNVGEVNEAFLGTMWDSFKNIFQGQIPNFEDIFGSVKEPYIKMLIKNKQFETYEIAKRKVSESNDFGDLEKNLSDTIHESDAAFVLASDYIQKNANKDVELDETTVQTNLVMPIRLAGGVSPTYDGSKISFESELYGKVLGKSELNNHELAEKLLDTRSYYTAYIEQTKRPGLNRTVSLQSITFPPPKINAQSYMDPVALPHLYLNYFKYVDTKILEKKENVDPKAILEVSPKDKRFWGIMEFDEWAKSSEATTKALDPLDEKPALRHSTEVGLKRNELSQLLTLKSTITPVDKQVEAAFTEVEQNKSKYYTELELEIGHQFKNFFQEFCNNPEIKSMLKPVAGGRPDEYEIDNYLYGYDSDPSKLGILMFNENGNSRLFEMANEIDNASNGQKSRQKALIDEEIGKRLEDILHDQNRFFKQVPSFTRLAVQKWPSLMQYRLARWII